MGTLADAGLGEPARPRSKIPRGTTAILRFQLDYSRWVVALRSVPPRRSEPMTTFEVELLCAQQCSGCRATTVDGSRYDRAHARPLPTTTDPVGVRAYPAVLTSARADVFFGSANRVTMATEPSFAHANRTLARADRAFELRAPR